MANHERPSAEDIRAATRDSGLNLSEDDLRRLAAGDELRLEGRHGGAEEGAAGDVAGRRCPGILVYPLTQVCGIYLQFNPTRIGVCCDFPG
jgi:hypothetical protein